jgi:hypothetical protein
MGHVSQTDQPAKYRATRAVRTVAWAFIVTGALGMIAQALRSSLGATFPAYAWVAPVLAVAAGIGLRQNHAWAWWGGMVLASAGFLGSLTAAVLGFSSQASGALWALLYLGLAVLWLLAGSALLRARKLN